jgi:hypothetical protein
MMMRSGLIVKVTLKENNLKKKLMQDLRKQKNMEKMISLSGNFENLGKFFKGKIKILLLLLNF